MPFYVSEVITRVRDKVAEEDPNNSFFSDIMIIRSINSNLLTLCRDLGITNQIITLNTLPNIMEYTLPDNVCEVKEVWFEKDGFRYEVSYAEWDDFLKRYDDNKKGDILVAYYLRNELTNEKMVFKIGFYPIPSKEINVNLQVLVNLNEVNSSDDIIPLPNKCLTPLVYLVLVDLYERDKRYDEANYFYSKYRDIIMIEQTKEKSKIVEYVE